MMKIAKASSVFSFPEVRKNIGLALAEGEHVLVEPAGFDVFDPAHAPAYSRTLQRNIQDGRTAIASIHLDEHALNTLTVTGMTVDASTGTVAGAGIDTLLEQIKTFLPMSAAAFDAACVLIGSAAIRGLFDIYVSGTLQGYFRLGLEAVNSKAEAPVKSSAR
jgi:hypothetical protein